VTDKDITDVKIYAVAETYLATLRSAFGVAASTTTATVMVRAVDSMGNPLGGIPGAALSLNAPGVKGPYFVDSALQPKPTATATAGTGLMIYFDVPATTLKITAGTGYTVTAADTPTAAGAVTLVDAVVVDKQMAPPPPPPPSNVSFQQSVLPIFMTRGCYNCHSGNGAGRRLGGLVLDGAPQKIWAALTLDISPNFGVTRVNLQTPEKSLVLTMPSYSNPPNGHPTVIFTSSADPDYQTILVWIREGAKYN
jgi:hypothetical protein